MYSYSISVFAIFKKYLEKDKTVPFSLLHKASNIRLCGHKYMHSD